MTCSSAWMESALLDIGRISSFDIHLATRPGLASLDVLVSLGRVPRSVFAMSKESFLDGGVGLIQRIENRVSGIPSLLGQARADLERAQETITEVAERIGQPFRHAQALARAEDDLACIERSSWPCLDLAADAHAIYLDDNLRRIANQAMFERINIVELDPDDPLRIDTAYAEPFHRLLDPRAHAQALELPAFPERVQRRRNP